MKRDASNIIVTKRLGKFEVMRHDVSIDKVRFEDLWNCIYEHVEVYTDAGQPLVAYRYCPPGWITCFDKIQETPSSKVMLFGADKHYLEVMNWNWGQYNAYHNCFGFCILDGSYWINLTSENLNTIIFGDSYTEVNFDCNTDHLVFYYLEGSPVHVSRFNAGENRYEHKIGCNTHIPSPTSDVSGIYKYDTVKCYKKA